MNYEACESFIDFCDNMMLAQEGKIADKLKLKFRQKNRAGVIPVGNGPTLEDKDIMSYLNKKYASQISDIIEDEYKNNKSKYDQLAAALVQKAINQYPNRFDGDEEVDFDINIGPSFSKRKEKYHYSLDGEFFQVDQDLGFEIEGELEKSFFSAIRPKIQKLCGSKFVRIEGDMDDYPGGMSVILKCSTADMT